MFLLALLARRQDEERFLERCSNMTWIRCDDKVCDLIDRESCKYLGLSYLHILR